MYTGTVLSLSPSVHVQDDAATRPRDEKNMAVRIDEKVHSKEDVQALGIAAGDYVCYDPKTTITDSGFVKSRFLDDKASAACLLTLLWQMHETGTRPRYETCFALTVHEEVGHGGATLPTVDELLAVDMGCIGEDLGCTEYQVSICAKDSGGPYDYGMVSRLVALAKEQGVDHSVDIYPHYGSDVGAAWGGRHGLPGGPHRPGGARLPRHGAHPSGWPARHPGPGSPLSGTGLMPNNIQADQKAVQCGRGCTISPEPGTAMPCPASRTRTV